MKKTLLCAALIAALSACDNNSNNASGNAQAPQQSQSASKALSGAAQAEAAETRLKDLFARSNQNVNSMKTLLDQSGIQTFEFSLDNYQRGEQSSTATTALLLQFSPQFAQIEPALQEPIKITLDTTIDHADALAEQGIIAKAVSRPIIDEAFGQRFELGESETRVVRQLIEKIRIDTLILTDDNVEQHIIIEPLDLEKNGDKLSYAGLDVQAKFKQSDIGSNPVYPSTFDLKSGKFSFIDSHSEFEIEPFEGSGESKADGDMHFTSTPLHIHGKDERGEQIEIRSDKLEYRGEKLVYDDAIGNFLGKQSYAIDSLTVVNNLHKFEFGKISFASDTQKNGELYNMGLHSQAAFVTDLIQQAAGISGVKINDLDIKFDLNKLSAQSINLIQQSGHSIDPADDEAYEAIMRSISSDFSKNGSELLLDAALNTEAGTATAKGHMKLAGVPADMDFTTVEPDVLFQYADAALLLRVPEAIPQATGMAAMMEMQAADFLKKEDGHYVLDFSLKDGKAVLNGKPLPL